MKLFSFLFLAASISASTLLAPLYDLAAQQIIVQIKGAIGGIKDQISADGASTAILEQFETAFNDLDPQVVVDLLKQMPVEDIMEGGLSADDFAGIFADVNSTAMDGIDFTALNDEILANLNASDIAAFEQAMDAALQVTSSIQELYDSEITISNFLGVFTDIVDAVVRVNGVYGGSSTTTAILQKVLLGTSLMAEKAVYFFENFKDFKYMYEDAVMLTKLEYERRIQKTLDIICEDEFNSVNFAIDVTKFSGSVVIDNWSEPVKTTADVWNTLVGNIPYLDDWQLSDKMVSKIEWYVQSAVDSVEGSLTELRILLLPLRGVIDGFVQNMSGC